MAQPVTTVRPPWSRYRLGQTVKAIARDGQAIVSVGHAEYTWAEAVDLATSILTAARIALQHGSKDTGQAEQVNLGSSPAPAERGAPDSRAGEDSGSGQAPAPGQGSR